MVESIKSLSGKCDKLVKHQDENGTINDRYIITFCENTSSSYIELFIKDLMAQNFKHDCEMKVKNVQPLLSLKILKAELNLRAMEYVN